MAGYNVHLNDIPKVGDNGKPLPIKPYQAHEFEELDEAKNFASENKDKFERVTLMQMTDDGTKMVERFMDGEHIVAEA